MSVKGESPPRLLTRNNFKVECGEEVENLRCIKCHFLLDDPYETNCGCKYCYICLKAEEDGDKYCMGGKDQCYEDPLIIGVNVYKNDILNQKVLKVKVRCPEESCGALLEWGDAEGHLQVCKLKQECPYSALGCTVQRASGTKILTHLQEDVCRHSMLLANAIIEVKKDVKDLNTSNEDKRRSSTEQDKINGEEVNLTMRLTEENGRRNIQFKDLKKETEKKEETAGKMDVEDFTEGYREVTLKLNKSSRGHVSEPFYSHEGGYRLILKAIERMGQLSVYVTLVPGEYDHLLRWPCGHSITISLINQHNGHIHKSDTLNFCTVTDDIKNLFYRPKRENRSFQNGLLGYPSFISSNDLQKVIGLINDDLLMFKCSVYI